MTLCSRCGDMGFVIIRVAVSSTDTELHRRPCRCPIGQQWQAMKNGELGLSRRDRARAARVAKQKEGKEAKRVSRP